MKYENLLIDGPYLAHRSWDAPYTLVANGQKVTMIHSFMMTLQSLRKRFAPNQIFIAWESHGTQSWRKVIYPEYKPSKPAPTTFISQLTNLQRMLSLLGYPQFSADGNEADDVIGKLAQTPRSTVIFTVDKDICQLVNDHVHVWTGHEMMDSAAVLEKYKVPPKDIPKMLAICGDPSDSIPGFRGYGPVKAASLLAACPFNEIRNLDQPSLQLNLKLATLNTMCILRKYELDDKSATLDGILSYYHLHKLKASIELFRNRTPNTSDLSNFY